VEGLFEYLEVLIEEGGVVGGLIKGKVSTLINGINKSVLFNSRSVKVLIMS
jgi:hypothetical protein